MKPVTVKVALLIVCALAAVGGVLGFVPPIHQDLAYHQFADQRTWLGIPHAADVLSNAGFLAVGVWGLRLLYGSQAGQALRAPLWTTPYAVFLIGVAAVGFGSAYYHWAPANAPLVWDRLPMTVGFMGLFATLIADRISARAGEVLLPPLVLLGVMSVVYWGLTDDLRPYALVQFLPIVLALILCALFPPRHGLTRPYVAWLFLGYGAAKGFEAADEMIWEATHGIVSGHTLKHLSAALACAAVVWFIKNAGKPNPSPAP